jgi:hypothetical protein
MPKTEKKLRILRKTTRVEFWYKDEFFVYEYREDNKEGYEFIWKDQEKIYGPFQRDWTEEGQKVYNAIHKKLYPNKK